MSRHTARFDVNACRLDFPPFLADNRARMRQNEGNPCIWYDDSYATRSLPNVQRHISSICADDARSHTPTGAADSHSAYACSSDQLPSASGRTRMSLVGLRQHRKQTHPLSHTLCTPHALGFSAVIPSPKRAAKGIYNNCRLVTRGVLTARAYPDCQATTVAARGSDDADLRICKNIRITIFARRAHAP